MKGPIVALALVIATTAGAGVPSDGPAQLVANINRATDSRGSSDPQDFTAAAGAVFFTVSDEHAESRWDRVLWRTDGTPAGTRIVAELGIEIGYPYELVAFGDDLVVAGDDLWRTDGTPAGTQRLETGSASQLTLAGSTLFFVRDQLVWATDGSPGGARSLGELGLSEWPRDLVAVGGALFFTGCDPQHGCELWHSDGSAEGTGLVADLAPGPANGRSTVDRGHEHAVLGGELFFLAETSEAGVELWRSDGTAAGTRLVRDVNPGPATAFAERYSGLSDYAPQFGVLDDALYFIASDGVHGFELWRTDGSDAGTIMVADLIDGPSGIFDSIQLETPCELNGLLPATVPGHLFFVTCKLGDDYSDPVHHLWQTDGTALGTVRVESDIGGPIAALDGALYFTRESHEPRGELRRRDASAAPSTLVAALEGSFWSLSAVPGGLAISAYTYATGSEPWWSDGTPAGTYLLRDIRGDDAGAEPRDLVAYDGQVLFTADDGVHGRELWRSDASAAGTVLVADARAGPLGAEPDQLVALGDVVLFAADDGTHGSELWRSDGTAGGTWLVADINPGGESSAPGCLGVAGEQLFFYADDGVHGRELWRSDGTAAGTALVLDVRPGSAGSDAREGGWRGCADRVGASTSWRGSLYFSADDGVHGVDLWRSDGSAAGTALVADLDLAEHGELFALFAASDRVFFSMTGQCPCTWSTDGTAAGTYRLSYPPWWFEDAITIGETTYANGDGDGQFDLWRRDPGGDWVAVPSSDGLYAPFEIDGVLFAETGRAPFWRQGVTLEWPEELQGVSFSRAATAGRHMLLSNYGSRELWTSDGTTATYLLQEIPPVESGRADSEGYDLDDFTAAGDHFFFTTNAGEVGRELWALPIDVLPEVCVECFEPTPTPGPATPTPRPDCDGSCTLVTVGEVSGMPGDVVSVAVHLTAQREPIAGVEADLQVAPGLRVAAKANGHPDCRSAPEIDKPASAFAFLPAGCTPGVDCTVMRALIISLVDVEPIADGARLFECRVAIAADARSGRYPVAVTSVGASSPDGQPVAIGAADGAVTVLPAPAQVRETGSASGCQTAGLDDGGAWMLLLATPLFALARRSRSALRV